MVNRHQGDCIPKDLVSTHGDVFLSIHPSLKRAWDFGPWLGPPAEKLSPSTIQQALNCQLMRNKNYGKLALTNQKEATWHVSEAPLVGGPHMDILQGWPPLSSSPYKSINSKSKGPDTSFFCMLTKISMHWISSFFLFYMQCQMNDRWQYTLHTTQLI